MIDTTQTDEQAYYSGNGAQTSWAVPFIFGHPDHLLVYVRDTLTGMEPVATYGQDYSVTGGQFTDSEGVTAWETGSVEFTYALSSTEEVWILRRSIEEQGAKYHHFELNEKSHERQFDAIALRDQSLNRSTGRVIRFPASDNYSPLSRSNAGTLPVAATRKDSFLGFDASGDPEPQTTNPVLVPSAHMEDFVEAATADEAKFDIETPNESEYILNPGFQIDQRAGTYTALADDTYCLDGWNFLNESNRYDISQNDSTEAGSPNFMRINCATGGANQKWAVVQILSNEQTDALLAMGSFFTLGLRARRSVGITLGTAFDMEIWSYTGTADASPSDIVLSWGAAGVAPTPAAGWANPDPTFLSTKTATTSWESYNQVRPLTGTGIKNVAIVIGNYAAGTVSNWTLGHYLDIKDLTLTPGNYASWYRSRLYQEDLERCYQRYWKTFPYGTAPASMSLPGAIHTMAKNAAAPAFHWVFDVRNPSRMVKAPTVTTFNTGVSSATAIRNITDATSTNRTISGVTRDSFYITPDVGVNRDKGDEIAVQVTCEANPHA